MVALYDMVCDAVEQEARRLADQATGPIRVFDVCCGIGTIGLYMRKKLGEKLIGQIVGIGNRRKKKKKKRTRVHSQIVFGFQTLNQVELKLQNRMLSLTSFLV